MPQDTPAIPAASPPAGQIDREALMDLAVDLGCRLQTCGGSVRRVEEALTRLFLAYGAQGDVYAVSNCLIVSLHGGDQPPLTRMCRVSSPSTNLDLLEAYNDVSRRLCTQAPDYDTARTMLDTAQNRVRRYALPVVSMGAFLSGAVFCLYNQGSPLDMLWAGLCSAAAVTLSRLLAQAGANAFFRTLLASFLAAFLSYSMTAAGLAVNREAVIIGSLLLLLPGLVFTNFIRDIIAGDTTAGLSKMVEALLITAAISGGVALALSLGGLLFGALPAMAALPHRSILLRSLLIGLTGIGSCLLLNTHGPGILLSCLAALVGSAVNLGLAEAGWNIFICSLAAGAAISLYAETMARIRKCPAASYLIVAMYPLVPGSILFRALNHALQGNSLLFLSTALQAIAIAGCLAAGTMIASTLFRLFQSRRFH